MKIGVIHVMINGADTSLISTDQYAEVTYDDLVMLAGKTPGTEYNIVYDNRRMLGGGIMEPGDEATLYDGAHVYVYPGP